MTGDPRAYEEYIDSGLPWLGQVPKHWDVLPAFACYAPREVKNTGLVESTVLSLSYGRIVVKPPEKLHGLVPESFETYQIAEPGDIIIRTTDLQNDKNSLRVGQVGNRGIITSAYLCLRAKEQLTPEYGYQFLNVWDLTKGIYGYGSGLRQNLDFSHFKRMPVTIPPKDEQNAIVGYLAEVDQEVDRFIQNRQRLIAVLNEQKQAIINRAVTRGLDPDAPLKPSGIEWLGDIPKHWSRCRLRNVVRSVTSGSRGWSKYAADEGPLFVRITNLRRVSLNMRFDDVVRLDLPSTAEVKRTRVKPGDILMSITAYIGSIAVVPEAFEEAYVSQHVARCHVGESVHNSWWIGYVLLSEMGQTHGKLSLYGGTKDGLSLDDVKNYPILLPPQQEQNALVSYLDTNLQELNRSVTVTEREIDLIREYRTRLVTDVVTGKLAVPRQTATIIPISTATESSAPAEESQPQRRANKPFQRAVFAAEIVHRLHAHPTFGHVKFEKLMFLCEHHCGVDFDSQYTRQAAGPLDRRGLYSIDKQIRDRQWYQAQKGEKGWRYVPMAKAGEHRKYFDRYFADVEPRMDYVLNLLGRATTQQCEIVATLYSAWHDLLTDNDSATDDQIVREVLTNWTDTKKQIPEERWRKALAWMKEKQLTPAV